MYNHEPPNYDCPFCAVVAEQWDKYTQAGDIIYQNDLVFAKISPKWRGNNPGEVLVIPKRHVENIYDIPDDLIAECYKIAKQVAIGIRSTYEGCTGTSTRLHNEPDGGQDVWHLHVHVSARYPDDNLYRDYYTSDSFADSNARAPYAKKLRDWFANQ